MPIKTRSFFTCGLLVFAVTSLHAGIIFQFNESDDISYSLNGASYVAMPNGVLEPDPTGGVFGDVLVYNLTSELDSFELFNGDVPIGSSLGIIGDLRFTDQGGEVTGSETCGGGVECLMIFYVFDNNGLPADVGDISTAFLITQTPATTLVDSSFSYTAGAVTYDGTVVPEPAPTLTMLGGLSVLAFLYKFRRRSLIQPHLPF